MVSELARGINSSPAPVGCLSGQLWMKEQGQSPGLGSIHPPSSTKPRTEKSVATPVSALLFTFTEGLSYTKDITFITFFFFFSFLLFRKSRWPGLRSLIPEPVLLPWCCCISRDIESSKCREGERKRETMCSVEAPVGHACLCKQHPVRREVAGTQNAGNI